MLALSVFASREALMQAAALRLSEALTQAITVRGFACAALSGGSTPEPAYRALGGRRLDWRQVRFALVDERFVPPEHEASNEAMLRLALAPALAHGATLLPLYAPLGDVALAAARAEALYAPLRIDIVLMGMGEDAHTASWFPGAAGLGEALDPASARTVTAIRAPQATGAAERLTLTRAAIARAHRVLLLITGAAKRARLEAALSEPVEQAPVGALFSGGAHAPEVLWAP
jgi:6-phosphogluconolactonase